ncbi:hypothetical protein ACH9L7_06350 [Haloferax sp. S1W]|uniref:hypothetical protein n=1 Tax=Haloferax sp. S1W TaxID=3377110 RepID=UPI0037C8754B
MTATVDSWDEAVEVANEFMAEFTEERDQQPKDVVEATHRSAEEPETAEQLLTAESSVEAFADASGYTDELLLQVLGEQTGDQYRVVSHRVGDHIEFVYGEDDDCLEVVPLEAVYATFSIDKLGLETLLVEANNLVSTLNIGDLVVYRFIANDSEETDIILSRGTQVVSPTFERTMWSVLEEKYDGTIVSDD